MEFVNAKRFLFLCVLLTSFSAVFGQLPGFRVVGRQLFDRCGEEVILRGVNKMTVWTDINGTSFPEIAKTGANCVRIVWVTTGDVDKFDKAIAACYANQMIPMVELHDATGEWSKLSAMVDWWVKPEVVSVIQKHEEYLLVNIANECGNQVSNNDFKAGYTEAVTRMRIAGIHVPLVIDGAGWGKDIDILQAVGPELITADPDHNLLFSVHMWWIPEWGYSDQKIKDEIAQSVQMNLPLIIGEFGNTAAGCTGVINYKLIMEECQKNGIGWLAWSWGPGNSDCPSMDMTDDSKFETLRDWGLEVAVTDPNSIKNTSVRPKSIVDGACEGSNATRFSISVIPSGRGIVTISPNKAIVDSGTVITLTAVPDENNEFLNWSGSVEGSENPLSITVTGNLSITAAFTNNGPSVGAELVANGDFSAGEEGWAFWAGEGAEGTFSVVNGEAAITMTTAGDEGWKGQIKFVGIDISQGKTYLVSFKARASEPYELQTNVGLNEEPWTTYSGYKTFTVGTEMDSFSFEFTMSLADDRNSRIVFDVGTFAGNLYLDDVSIKTLGGSSIERGITAKRAPAIKPITVLSRGSGKFTITTASNISGTFELLDISGKCVARLNPGRYSAGSHNLSFNTSNLSSGAFFIRFSNPDMQFCTRVVNILR